MRKILSKGPKYREPQPFTWKQNFKIIMDSVEEYARSWSKREDVSTSTLSEWIKAIRRLLQRRIYMRSRSVDTRPKSAFNDDVTHCLRDLHDKYVIVPADKASNNIVFVCKLHYYRCLINELGLGETIGNSTYKRTTLSKPEIISNHRSVLESFGITSTITNADLPSLYWIPKLHKTPFKQRFIAGSSRCSTKPLSVMLTSILSTIKEGLQRYCDKIYSHSGINQMWILKNSKELIENLQARSLSSVTSIQTFDFSTLYTTIPHAKLKSRLKDLISLAFSYKNGKARYQYIVVGYKNAYFVKNHSDSENKFNANKYIHMLEFLIDNIFVEFGGEIFQQVIGIPMGTNCAPLLADLFLYSYEAEFIQTLLKDKNNKGIARRFNFTHRYIDDVLSLNNPRFSDYLEFIYPDELEIKNTTESDNCASYLDLRLEFDKEYKLSVQLYDKRDDFNFPIVNFPHMCSN